MADVAIVGAGVGGLAAAIDVAARGDTVTVYERHHEVGGKLGRVVIDGVEADTGPSVLTLPHVFAELFADAGVRLEDELELVEHAELADIRFADGTRLVLHHDVDETLARVADALGAETAAELRAFLRYAAGIWREAAPAFVYGDAPTIGSALTMGLQRPRALRGIDPLRTMMQGIRAHVKHPHLRDLLARYATYNGSDPRRAPATLNCIAHVELTLGGWGVRGGMVELARAMERVALQHGVRFELGTPVEAVRATRRGIEVVTGRAASTVDAVIVNADVAHLFADLWPDPSFEPPPPSMSGWTALLKTRRSPRLAHAVLFPERYLDEFADIFDAGVVPRDPTVYVCGQEPAHRRAGFAEHELLFCMANAPATNADRGSDVAALRERVLRKLRASNVVDDDAEVVWERAPSGLAAQFPGTHGAIYGASSNSRFAAFQRPANRVAGAPGLYLASGSAHPGGGVPLCALSGRAAARAVAADYSPRRIRART